jgi:methionine sulfoxide reductase heme-binding subunit
MRHARSTRLIAPVARPEPAGGWAIAALAGAGLLVGTLVLGAGLAGRTWSPVTWYLARASGMTLYLLLWLSTLLGLGLTTTLLDRFGGRAVVYSLHGFVTSLAYGFLSLHVLSLASDQWIAFGPVALLVPFASPWREPWTGFGVVAGELLVVIGASFAVRRYTGYRAWRALHWLTFPLFGLGVAHGIGAGTDSRTVWAQIIYLVTCLSIVWLVAYRILRGRAPARPPKAATRSHPPLDRLTARPIDQTDAALQRPAHPLHSV